MNKKEFLDILRQSLEGEVDNNTIENNIRYYSEYISSYGNKSEEEVIDDLGDPRLIAKTIIETEKMSDRTNPDGRYDGNNHRNEGYYDDYTRDRRYEDTDNKGIYSGSKWFFKLAALVIVFIFLSLLIRIGWFFIRLLSVFFVPVVLIVLLLIIFRRR